MKVYPELQQFMTLAKEHLLVPVVRKVAGDTETAVSLYGKLIGEDIGFMLESAEPEKNFGRYSLLGRKPFARLTGYRNKTKIVRSSEGGEKGDWKQGTPLEILDGFMAGFQVPELEGLPAFIGGAVGYVAYEATITWERIRGMNPPENEILSDMMVCREMAIMDHLDHSISLVYLADTVGIEPEKAYEQAIRALKDMENDLHGSFYWPEEQWCGKAGHSAGIDEKKQEHLERVGKIQEYITAGDAFQVVLSRQIERPLVRHPFRLYRRLRRVNPSPYMFYVNFGRRKVLGASPERLVKVSHGQVSTHPIAGTRPRGKTLQEDQALGEDLAKDPKELAEHAMLVDLGRNDLGKVSVPGTVEVTRMMEIGRFSHVMHMISEVQGKMDPAYRAVDALKACFPAGTVSGAPKARAMEIIHELEGDFRGVYGGAVGYLDFRGNMDTCIALRTLTVENDKVLIRSGGGIVADSVPEMEYHEVRHKAEALMKALEDDDDGYID